VDHTNAAALLQVLAKETGAMPAVDAATDV